MQTHSAWRVGLGGIGIGGVVYGLIMLLLKVEEGRGLLDLLGRVLRRLRR